MAEDVSNKELYSIVNRAIAKWGCFDNEPADKEINIFCHKYDMRRKNNPQINIFENTLPSPEDVAVAKQMCSDLQTYRDALDIYDEKEEDFSEDFYRRFYNGIERFSSCISEDNQIRYKTLKQNLQRHLPEFAETVQLEDYNQQIDIINYLKNNKNSEYKTRAIFFFNQITTINEDLKDEIKELSPSSDKIAFCEKCINIVDCLPQEKYSRSAKFTIKRNLYSLISETAREIGGDYDKTAEIAQSEANRYQKSINNAQQYARSYMQKSDVQKNNKQKPKRRTTLSVERRNRMAMDDWLYK